MELVDLLVEQLGITPDQARGGVGAILSLAKEKLEGNYAQLTEAIPELAGMEDAAPGGGAPSLLGGLTASLSQNLGEAGVMVRLGEMFSTLDLKGDMMGRFLPLVIGFIQSKGGDTAKNLLVSVLK